VGFRIVPCLVLGVVSCVLSSGCTVPGPTLDSIRPLYPESIIAGREAIFRVSWIHPQIEYEWRFGDGNSSRQGSATHTYAFEGNYHVVLNVSLHDDYRRFEQYLPVGFHPAIVVEEAILGMPFNVSANLQGNRFPIVDTQWNVAGLEYSKSRSFALAFDHAGTYSINLKIRDASNRTFEAIRTITLDPVVLVSYVGERVTGVSFLLSAAIQHVEGEPEVKITVRSPSGQSWTSETPELWIKTSETGQHTVLIAISGANNLSYTHTEQLAVKIGPITHEELWDRYIAVKGAYETVNHASLRYYFADKPLSELIIVLREQRQVIQEQMQALDDRDYPPYYRDALDYLRVGMAFRYNELRYGEDCEARDENCAAFYNSGDYADEAFQEFERIFQYMPKYFG
jgi:hypothetical protein